MIQRCFALSYYLYCLRLRCLVSFSFYSTIFVGTANHKCFPIPILTTDNLEEYPCLEKPDWAA
ncbi:Uncharacterised protein [Neisseria animalis]|nr:Uncharacterised protein [Neisseria animalis]